MYGREKTAVVQPTNAVNATRNTFSGSMKNSSCNASSGPAETTRTVSAHAATNVAKLKATLMSRATPRWPVNASTTLPASGQARTTKRKSASTSGVLQLLEVADVEAVELLADLEHEDAQDQDADQDVECDAELDHHRHAVGRRGGGEEEAVLHRQEADHLRHRLRA